MTITTNYPRITKVSKNIHNYAQRPLKVHLTPNIGTELIPNAVETIPPWKRDDTSIYGHTVQHEFPAWASNKDYLQYNSPSSRFTGGRDKMSGQQTTPPQPPLVSALRKQKSQLIEGGQGSSSVQEGRRASSLDNIINALQKLNLTPKSINSNLRLVQIKMTSWQ